MRYFFEIRYKGTHYHGWQSQANAVGIQQMVEEVLGKLLREQVSIVGSGRTDTGVHCCQQFFHTDIKTDFDQNQLKQRLNSFLDKDIAIRSIRPVKSDASARYSALERTYEYRITRVKDPFLNGFAWFVHKPIDVPTLQRASALLIGTHDFQCFSKVKTDVNHFVCKVRKAEWVEKESLLVFTISANRFLRGMVRAIVGTLMDAGTGKISVDDLRHILKSKDRRKAGQNVPAEGLFLTQVRYPKQIFLI
ncbi:MAG: tRNA pseudouridine(38-40) synthase TruA [Bacteroidetes bacterium]|nr:tRNA pseudouridine(38-40) synthase TruA [Bacteroidota bacterium]MBS1975774.1 tRNA pseudouridine(38-40) synthase TruA [Bacteroidota bacterium]